MHNITFARLSDENFNINSMDEFLRYEKVTQIWKNVGGEYVLSDTDYTIDWNLEKRRGIAKTILQVVRDGGFAFGAFDGSKFVGYILGTGKSFGSTGQYTEIALYHISTHYRRMGIGKELFRLACIEARSRGAQKLYISSGPTKNTQAAYRSLGCVPAMEIDQAAVERNPADIQLEFTL